MMYPISYSIPQEMIVPYVPFKMSHTAKHDYQFTDELSYLKNYRNSIFGETRLKCGWDCLRHYEILSQGTIPYFHDLEKCPKQTLHNFPKEQILALMKTYGSQTFDDIMKNSSSILYNDIDELLNYTRNNLTTVKNIEYILSKTNTPTTKKILYIQNGNCPGDYMMDFTTHGLIQYTGGIADIYPDVPYIYDSYPAEDAVKLYGKGFGYSRKTSAVYNKQLSAEHISTKIKAREYDHILYYISCDRELQNIVDGRGFSLAFLSGDTNVYTYYAPNEISFICGRDCDPIWTPELNWYIKMNHSCKFIPALTNRGSNMFVREFGD